MFDKRPRTTDETFHGVFASKVALTLFDKRMGMVKRATGPTLAALASNLVIMKVSKGGILGEEA